MTKYFWLLFVVLLIPSFAAATQKTFIGDKAAAPMQAKKKAAPPAAAKPVVKPQPRAAAWYDLPQARRAKIVQGWQALPEATRPPFPIYRDEQLAR